MEVVMKFFMTISGLTFACILLIFMPIGFVRAAPPTETEAVETGRLLATLFDSGRVVIVENQPLINDPKKGEKGFTPKAFEKQLIREFKERSGVDLANLKGANLPEMAKKLLPQLVETSKSTISDNQLLINRPGLAFKGFIPAIFGVQTIAKFSVKTGIYMKQTTFDSFLRNPNNKADEFEAAVLKKFDDPSYPRQGNKIFSEIVDDGKSARVMLPLFYIRWCLICHGEPKGDIDISGYAKEGGKEGDLGGAISVKIPLE
jgi:general secretion pathway protein A